VDQLLVLPPGTEAQCRGPRQPPAGRGEIPGRNPHEQAQDLRSGPNCSPHSSGAPVADHFAPIESILGDLFMETGRLAGGVSTNSPLNSHDKPCQPEGKPENNL